MSIRTIVTRGYGSFGSVNLLPTRGYSMPPQSSGRFEFTIPSSRLELTATNNRLDFTIPKTPDEFTEVAP